MLWKNNFVPYALSTKTTPWFQKDKTQPVWAEESETSGLMVLSPARLVVGAWQWLEKTLTNRTLHTFWLWLQHGPVSLRAFWSLGEVWCSFVHTQTSPEEPRFLSPFYRIAPWVPEFSWSYRNNTRTSSRLCEMLGDSRKGEVEFSLETFHLKSLMWRNPFPLFFVAHIRGTCGTEKQSLYTPWLVDLFIQSVIQQTLILSQPCVVLVSLGHSKMMKTWLRPERSSLCHLRDDMCTDSTTSAVLMRAVKTPHSMGFRSEKGPQEGSDMWAGPCKGRVWHPSRGNHKMSVPLTGRQSIKRKTRFAGSTRQWGCR